MFKNPWLFELLTEMRKSALKILVIFVIVSILFIYLTFTYSNVFSIGIFLAAAIAGIKLMLLACPNCGHSLMYQEQQFFGIKLMLFVPWTPKACPNCGKKLNDNP